MTDQPQPNTALLTLAEALEDFYGSDDLDVLVEEITEGAR